MSLNFILIDDQKTVLESTSNYVKNFISENHIEAQISLYTTSPQDVLNYSNEKFDQMNIYILDINLKNEINGLALGRAIRDREPNSYIIFLTAYIELSMMVFKYKLKVFDFLVKPVSYAELSECLHALIEDYSRIQSLHLPAQNNFISLKSGYRENHISINDIIYIESFGPKLRIHTVDGQFEYYGTLKGMEKLINETTDTFYRSHKSFLINTKYIRSVNMKDLAVFMSNGGKCLISRNKKTFLKGFPLNNS
ncbi:MAG: LytTR family DNA-binding domain-containing protein [Dehalobacterium sp.]